MSNVSVTNLTGNAAVPLSVKLGISYQYIAVGSADALINLFLLLLLAINRDLLKKFAFMFGIAIGDTISGLSLFISGLVRLFRILDDSINNLVRPSECMPLIQIYVLGNQLVAAMFLFVGIERSIGVGFFTWYYKIWTDKISWLGNFCVLLVTLVSLAVSYILAFSQPAEYRVLYICSMPDVLGIKYSIYHIVVGAVGGAMAFVPTLVSYVVFHRRKKLMEKQGIMYTQSFKQSISSNLKMTKLLLVLALFDLTLVALPNLLQLLYLYNIVPLPELPAWLLQIQCLRGSLNFFIYILTNDEFRASFLKMIKYRKVNSVSTHHGNERTASAHL